MAAFDQKAMKNSFELLKGLLTEFDLQSMEAKLWKYITDTGSDDFTALSLWIEQQAEFKARFPAIAQRRAAKLAPISPKEYVQFEREARQVMQAAGLPSDFYNQTSDFTNLLAKDISIREIGDRIEQGFNYVARATPEVRSAFAKYYGANSDAALAAFFLNPNSATDVIVEAARKAQIGGAGAMNGLNLSLTQADKLADMGVDYEQALAGMAQVAALAPLFSETAGEAQAHLAKATGAVKRMAFDPNRDLVDDWSRGSTDPQVPSDKTTNGDGAQGDSTGQPWFITVPKGKVLRAGLRWDPVTGEVLADSTDMSGEDEGVATVFGTDPKATARAKRRLAERTALLGGGGGAAVSGEGSSLGVAEGRRRR